MKKYKFEWLNKGVEIVNPIITINSDNIAIFPSNMTIDVDILMTTPNGTKFGIRLEDVKVQNLSFDESTLEIRVLDKLKDFEV